MKRHLLSVFIFLLIIHLPYVPNGFIWLDHNDIEQGSAVLPLGQINKAFIIPFGQTSFYRPIVTIVNSIDYALYRLWAPGYHITNLLIFIVLIYASLKFVSTFFNLDKKYFPYFVLAMGVHPVGIFIAGAINQRQESLLVLFMLLCLHFYVTAKKTKSNKPKLLTLLFWILALFTKETALVILPLLIILYETVNREKLKLKQAILPIGFATITLFYLLLRLSAVPNLWGTSQPLLTGQEHITLRFYLLEEMFIDLVSPFKPSLSDATLIPHFSTPLVGLTILVVGGGLFYIIKKGLTHPALFALVTTFIMLLPGLAIVPVPRIGSPHYSFLALSSFLAFVFVLTDVQKKILKTLTLAVFAIWVLLASYSTFLSGFLFKNDETLFTNEVQTDNNFSEAYYYLGNYHLKKANFQKASENFLLAQNENPKILSFKNPISVKVNLATSYIELDNLDEAENLLEAVFNESDDSLKQYITYNQAVIAQKKSDYTRVIELLEGKVWNMPEPYLLLAATYHEAGYAEKEIETLENALPLMSLEDQIQFQNYIKELERD